MSDPILFPSPQQPVGGGRSGDGGDLDARLRLVEGDLREFKTRMDTVATKSDIKDLAATTKSDIKDLAATTKSDIKDLAATMKIWILSSTVVALVIVVGWLVTWVVRLATS